MRWAETGSDVTRFVAETIIDGRFDISSKDASPLTNDGHTPAEVHAIYLDLADVL